MGRTICLKRRKDILDSLNFWVSTEISRNIFYSCNKNMIIQEDKYKYTDCKNVL